MSTCSDSLVICISRIVTRFRWPINFSCLFLKQIDWIADLRRLNYNEFVKKCKQCKARRKQNDYNLLVDWPLARKCHDKLYFHSDRDFFVVKWMIEKNICSDFWVCCLLDDLHLYKHLYDGISYTEKSRSDFSIFVFIVCLLLWNTKFRCQWFLFRRVDNNRWSFLIQFHYAKVRLAVLRSVQRSQWSPSYFIQFYFVRILISS